MKVSVHIVSNRVKGYGSNATREEYDLVNIAEAKLSKKATADVLRALADDIDPAFPNIELTEAVLP